MVVTEPETTKIIKRRLNKELPLKYTNESALALYTVLRSSKRMCYPDLVKEMLDHTITRIVQGNPNNFSVDLVRAKIENVKSQILRVEATRLARFSVHHKCQFTMID